MPDKWTGLGADVQYTNMQCITHYLCVFIAHAEHISSFGITVKCKNYNNSTCATTLGTLYYITITIAPKF